MINIKDCNPNLVKIDKKTFKNIDIYNIGYITITDSEYVNIHSVNPLYRIIGEADGSIKESNGNKYLTFADTDKNKEVLEKYTKLLDEIKNVIDKSGEYEKVYMKIKFNSDDNLPLNKILKLYNLTAIVRSVFEEAGKYYPKFFKMNLCMNYEF